MNLGITFTVINDKLPRDHRGRFRTMRGWEKSKSILIGWPALVDWCRRKASSLRLRKQIRAYNKRNVCA